MTLKLKMNKILILNLAGISLLKFIHQHASECKNYGARYNSFGVIANQWMFKYLTLKMKVSIIYVLADVRRYNIPCQLLNSFQKITFLT